MEKINYTLTLEDCNNYVRSQIKIPRLKKYFQKNCFKVYIKYTILLTIIAFIFFGSRILDICTRYHLTLLSIITNKGFSHFLISQMIQYSLFIIFFILLLFIFTNLKRYLSGGKVVYKMLSGMDLNYEVSISEENLTRTNKNGIIIINWETIKDIYDTKYNYLIFVSDVQAIIIPKRCFESEEHGKKFYEQIQTYCTKAKQN